MLDFFLAHHFRPFFAHPLLLQPEAIAFRIALYAFLLSGILQVGITQHAVTLAYMLDHPSDDRCRSDFLAFRFSPRPTVSDVRGYPYSLHESNDIQVCRSLDAYASPDSPEKVSEFVSRFLTTLLEFVAHAQI